MQTSRVLTRPSDSESSSTTLGLMTRSRCEVDMATSTRHFTPAMRGNMPEALSEEVLLLAIRFTSSMFSSTHLTSSADEETWSRRLERDERASSWRPDTNACRAAEANRCRSTTISLPFSGTHRSRHGGFAYRSAYSFSLPRRCRLNAQTMVWTLMVFGR